MNENIPSAQSFRVSLDHMEWDAVKNLMERFKIGTPQKLVRYLIVEKNNEAGEFDARYKKTAGSSSAGASKSAPNQKNLTKLKKEMAKLPGENLAKILKPLLAKKYALEVTDVSVGLNENNVRSVSTYAGGEFLAEPVEDVLNELEELGLLGEVKL